jgi:uncharacterized membrane protein
MLRPDSMSTVTRLRSVHPGWALVVLDLLGLAIAGYLAAVELGGGVPYCGALHGCDTVAQSEYSRIAGIPVAVYGVVLTVVTLALALAWIRTANPRLLDAVYGLSLVGVIFEGYFLFLQLFVIHAVCVWCTAYGLTVVARLGVAWALRRRESKAATRG